MTRWQGLVYRAHHPGWAWAPDSGEGAKLHGGRFNRPGVPALYTSQRPETAWLEAQAGFAFKAQPMTLCAYKVECADVVDLTNAQVLAAHGIATETLRAPWAALADHGEEVPTWTIADRLRTSGAAAVIVPSFAVGAIEKRDVNLVFWQWGPKPPHEVQVVDDHGRLPRDRSSWT